jgi:hypothetical protein
MVASLVLSMTMLLHCLLALAPLAVGSSHAIADNVPESMACQNFQRPILNGVSVSVYFRNHSLLEGSRKEENSDLTKYDNHRTFYFQCFFSLSGVCGEKDTEEAVDENFADAEQQCCQTIVTHPQWKHWSHSPCVKQLIPVPRQGDSSFFELVLVVHDLGNEHRGSNPLPDLKLALSPTASAPNAIFHYALPLKDATTTPTISGVHWFYNWVISSFQQSFDLAPFLTSLRPPSWLTATVRLLLRPVVPPPPPLAPMSLAHVSHASSTNHSNPSDDPNRRGPLQTGQVTWMDAIVSTPLPVEATWHKMIMSNETAGVATGNLVARLTSSMDEEGSGMHREMKHHLDLKLGLTTEGRNNQSSSVALKYSFLIRFYVPAGIFINPESAWQPFTSIERTSVSRDTCDVVGDQGGETTPTRVTLVTVANRLIDQEEPVFASVGHVVLFRVEGSFPLQLVPPTGQIRVRWATLLHTRYPMPFTASQPSAMTPSYYSQIVLIDPAVVAGSVSYSITGNHQSSDIETTGSEAYVEWILHETSANGAERDHPPRIRFLVVGTCDMEDYSIVLFVSVFAVLVSSVLLLQDLVSMNKALECH